jgi:lysophospholipase L1-like esterase
MATAALYGQKKADFSKFVVAGDSLSAGYQNSQLIESGQVHGYANVIATQAGVSLNLPIIPLVWFPPPLQGGYPQISIEQNYAVVTGLTPIPRLNTDQTLDVAVPGFTVAALVGLPSSCPPDWTNPIEVMAAEILNPPCTYPGPTELEEAAALKPTTAILWVGSNDVLFSLLFGTDPTDVRTFYTLHSLATTTLAHASKNLVVANIPDVTLTAYLTSVPKLADILNLPLPTVYAVFGLHPGDMVTPYAFTAIQAMGSSLKHLPNSDSQGRPIVIRAARLWQIRATVVAYNIAIAIEAAANHAILVDIYSLINDLAAHGAVVGGRTLTTDFMGGLFSLDGVHPTNTGYAIIANEFIKTMNRSLRADIPYVSVDRVSQADPLIFPESDLGKHTGHVSVGMADGLRSLGRR